MAGKSWMEYRLKHGEFVCLKDAAKLDADDRVFGFDMRQHASAANSLPRPESCGKRLASEDTSRTGGCRCSGDEAARMRAARDERAETGTRGISPGHGRIQARR